MKYIVHESVVEVRISNPVNAHEVLYYCISHRECRFYFVSAELVVCHFKCVLTLRC